ncbi:rRNA maturation RNase YbeY [Thermoanaerobacterium sp. DL9XJH110]|uniref:rRNA maturation RNase YbeY n=1 Tax=Thermoanaerobacterium sp. DL9XJH110 TaxID=3386643 RepID=UPI003BB6E0C6
MPDILISNLQDKIDVGGSTEKLLREVVAFALAGENAPEDVEVSLALVDDEYIQQLNKTYRSKDAPTDVLSFAMGEKVAGEEFDGVPEAERLLGDIVISVERAKRQAEEFGHSFERELAYLAVHGTLHLLGYDHEIEEEKRIMRQKEEQILKAFDLTRGEF